MSTHIEKIIALTPLQEGILYESDRSVIENLYSTQIVVSLTGNLSKDALERSVDELITRNQALRSYFKWEKIKQPVQVIRNTAAHALAYIDVSSTPQPELAAQHWLETDQQQPFDLNATAFRITLLKLGHQCHKLVISSHHILLDGWSNSVLMGELFTLYRHYATGQTLNLMEKTSLVDFRAAQLDVLSNSTDSQYWRAYLEGFAGNPTLPIARSENTSSPRTTRYCKYSMVLDKLSIDSFAQQYQVTVPSLMYAAWSLILRSYYNSADVSFGTAVTNRPKNTQGSSHVLALAIQTLPIRVRLARDISLLELIRQIQTNLGDCIEHLNFSLADILTQCNISPQMNLMNTLFVVENYPVRFDHITYGTDLTLDSVTHWECNDYPLAVSVTLFDQYEIDFQFATDYIDTAAVQRLAHYFIALIKKIVSEPQQNALTTGLLSDTDRAELHRASNPALFTDAPAAFAIDTFEGVVKRYPDQIALEQNQHKVSYRVLDNNANRLAHRLRHDIGSDKAIIAVMLEPSIDMITTMLAVMKSGATYLPIDIDNPDQRVLELIEDSGCQGLVTTSERTHAFKQCTKVKCIEVDNLSLSGVDHCPPPPRDIHAENLLYIIYTSGSTGKPKGVTISQGAFSQFTRMYLDLIPLHAGETVVSLTGIAFDIFFGETLTPLLAGCHVIVGGRELARDGQGALRLLQQQDTALFQATPSRLKMLLLFAGKKSADRRLNHLVVAGEAFPKALYRQARAFFGTHCKIYNLYGPTEATIYATGLLLSDSSDITIGHSLSNTESVILDRFGNMQPVGIPGELFLAGPSLSSGYLNKPELNTSSFIHFVQHADKRFYSTKDLAYYRDNGEINLIGRSDDQLKIRGYRVEIGEISTQIKTVRGVKEALVIADTDVQGFNQLNAFVIAEEAHYTDTLCEQIKQTLQNVLPAYMVPARIQVVENFPLNSNGKIDKKALLNRLTSSPPAPATTRTEHQEKLTEIETAIAEIWSDVLLIPQSDIGPDADFISLGGQSLKASRIVARLHKRLNLKLKYIDVFRNPTIRSLANLIQKRIDLDTARTEPSTTPAQAAESSATGISHTTPDSSYYPLTPQQTSMYLMQQLHDDTRYNLSTAFHITGALDIDRLNRAFCSLVERHQALRTSFELVQGKPQQHLHASAELLSRVQHQMITQHNVQSSTWENELRQLIKPHQLHQAPLLRATLLTVSATEHVLLVDAHHIIADGASAKTLLSELFALYLNEQLAPLDFDFIDFSSWYQSQCFESARQYWSDLYRDGITPTVIPSASKLDPRHEHYFAGARHQLSLSAANTERLLAYSKANSLPTASLLFSLLSLFIARANSKLSATITTPCENRLLPTDSAPNQFNLAGLVGMLVNTLAIRTTFTNAMTVQEAISVGVEAFLTGYENQSYPFESLVDDLKIDRRQTDALFPLMYLHQEEYTPHYSVGDLQFDEIELTPLAAKFHLMVTSRFRGNQLELLFDYRHHMFPNIEALTHSFLEFINQALAAPLSKVADLRFFTSSIIDNSERKIPGNTNTTTVTAPEQELSIVRQLWSEVLQIDEILITPASNFFELGGNSLQANHLVAELRERYQTDISLNQIFLEPTLAEIARRVSQATSTAQTSLTNAVAGRKVAKVTRSGYHSLTAAQQRIFLSQRLTADTSYNIPAAFKISGPIDHDRLTEALSFIVQRHDSLRTSFHEIDFTPVQRIALVREFHLQHETVAECDIDTVIKTFIQPFDLGQAPLFRVKLLTIDCHNHVLLFDAHHIVVDGVSLAIILDEFTQLYQGWVPDPKALDFADFAAAYEVETFSEDVQFWQQHLGLPPSTPAPLLPHTSDIEHDKGGRKTFTLRESSSAQLLSTAAKLGTTPFAVLFGCLSLALMAVSKREEIIVGTAVDNRDVGLITEQAVQLRRTVGMFANTLAIRSRVSGKNSILHTLENIAKQLHQCYQHQAYPFDQLIQTMSAATQQRVSALFTVMYVHEANYLPEVTVGNLTLVPLDLEPLNNKFELMVSSRLNQGCIEFSVDYGSTVSYAIDSILHYLGSTFEFIADHQSTLVEQIPPFTTAQSVATAASAISARAITTHEAQPTDIPAHILQAVKSAWSEVLEIDSDTLSLTSDFFQLGGHSLKANQMIGQLQALLKIEIPLSAFFKQPNIEALCHLIVKQLHNFDTQRQTLPPAPRLDHYPLTLAQQRLYFIERETSSTRYNIPVAYRCKGSVSLPSLQRAFSLLIERHSSLRTAFSVVNARPVQTIAAADTVTFQVIQERIPETQLTSRIAAFIRPFDLSQAPLLRATVLSLSDTDHVLLIDVHHLICDGLSLALLRDELNELYKSQTLPVKSRDFIDYVMWQQRQDHGDSETFWLSHFAGTLPSALFNSPAESLWLEHAEVTRSQFSLTADQSSRLLAVAQTHAVSPFCLFFTLVSVFLAKHAAQNEVVIATPVSNRHEKTLHDTGDRNDSFSLASLVGMFVNTIVIKSTITPTTSFSHLLSTTKELLAQCLEHQSYPLDRLIEKLSVSDKQAKQSLLSVMFTHEQHEKESWALGEHVLEPLMLTPQETKFNVMIQSHCVGSRVAFIIDHHKALELDMASFILRLQQTIDFCITQSDAVLAEHVMRPSQVPCTFDDTLDQHLAATDQHQQDNARPTEEVLKDIWASLLELPRERILATSNFFELGGHSLKANLMVLEIAERLSVEVPIAQVFYSPTLPSLARYINAAAPLIHYGRIPAAPPSDTYPASESQSSLYTYCRFDNNLSTTFNVPTFLRITGALDQQRFEAAFNAVLQRHDVLRSVFFENEGTIQLRIRDDLWITVDSISCTDRHDAIHREILKFIRPFDLQTGPLVRAQWLQFSPTNHLLMLDVHHIVFDGISSTKLFSDLVDLYEEKTLPPERLQYIDYVWWEKAYLTSDHSLSSKRYWQSQFSAPPPPLMLPSDYPRPARKSYAGSCHIFDLTPAVTKKIALLNRNTGTTDFMFLLSVLNVLLMKHTQCNDFVVGTVCSGRSHVDLSQIVGFFINSLALRNQPKPQQSYLEFLATVRDNTLNAYTHQQYPFSRVIADLKPRHDPSRSPLFDIMLVMQNFDESKHHFTDLQTSAYNFGFITSKYDLLFSASIINDRIQIAIEYSTQLFELPTVIRLAEDFTQITERTLTDPRQPLSEICLATAKEQEFVAGEVERANKLLDTSFDF